MAHVIEFQGRLARSDGKDVAAGNFDLRFRLHLAREGVAHVWEERHAGVRVATGGSYAVLLGSEEDLDAAHFVDPRWLGVYLDREGALAEVGERVPMTGATVRLGEQVRAINARLDATDAMQGSVEGGGPGHDAVDASARKRVLKLHRRLRRIEQGGGVVSTLDARLRDVEQRLTRLDDGEAGRVLRLEDELEDIVGQDGDIIDILERIEAIEKGHGGPMRLVKGTAEVEARVASVEEQNLLLQRQLEVYRKALELITARLAQPAAVAPAPEVLPGPLTVQKGGLHVAGGGLVVHDIEGRVAGASKREGPLLVNSRSGGDLIVGNKESGSVVAMATVRAGRVAGVSRTLAVRVGGEGLAPGDVVCLEPGKKQPTARACPAGGIPLGVVVERAAVELGEGAVVVAIAGIVKVRVTGAVPAGAVLEAGEGGSARPGEGPSVGRALAAAGPDSGSVEILLHAR
ncbi:hypothetical protein LBMAG42_35250 [Deltaproteobacteria bacterium]|nr:hypothetical protein LBMAG42_35250 [Deltaproteobacteria bacterium]